MSDNLFDGGFPLTAAAVEPETAKTRKTRKTSSKAREGTPKKTKANVSSAPTMVVTGNIKSTHIEIDDNRLCVGATIVKGGAITQFSSDNTCITRHVQYYSELGGVGIIVDPMYRILVPFNAAIEVPEGFDVQVKAPSNRVMQSSLQIADVDAKAMAAYLRRGVIPMVNLSDTRIIIVDSQLVAIVDLVERAKFSIGMKLK